MNADFAGPATGADRAVLLAHGAGAGRDAPALVAVADALAAAGVASLRFDFPYRAAGRKAPDRPAVLLGAVREAAGALGQRSGLPSERIVLGGRSMGGRYGSLAAGDPADPFPALGLLLLGYPLHPAGKPEQLRTEHFPRLAQPVCFISGDRDAMAPRPALEAAAGLIPGPVTFTWLAGADHGYRVPARSGRRPADVTAEVAETAVAFVLSLP